MRPSTCFLASLLWACGARDALLIGDTFQAPTGGGGSSSSGGGGAGGDGGAGAGGSGVGGVEQMALGAYHSCLRTFEGDVYCWGANYDGQIGATGAETPTMKPTRVELDGKATFLAAGTGHNCAVLADGRVQCWGANDKGQSGQADLQDVFTPKDVALDTFEASVDALALGEDISCAVRRDLTSTVRDLYCWGGAVPGLSINGATPTFVDSDVASVAAGRAHACWTRSDGQVLCSGQNNSLQCGVPGGDCDHSPVPLPLGFAATLVGSGHGDHTCAIADGFSIQCWGDNNANQLGAIGAGTSSPPVEVNFHPNFPVTGLGLGYFHSCVLAAQSGTVTCWGDNSEGQIGVGSSAPEIATPTNLPTLSGIVAVGSGTLHSCAYKSPTEIYCWGQNLEGQLGDGTLEPKSTPVQISLP